MRDRQVRAAYVLVKEEAGRIKARHGAADENLIERGSIDAPSMKLEVGCGFMMVRVLFLEADNMFSKSSEADYRSKNLI